MSKRTFHRDIDRLMEKRLSADQRAEVRTGIQEDLLRIRLSELRRQMNVTQYRVKGFSQPSVASLGKRRDLKLSTLVHYLQAIGMGVEINVFPRKRRATVPDKMVLLSA